MLATVKAYIASWIPNNWRKREGKSITFHVPAGTTDLQVIISPRTTPEDVAKLLVRISMGMETGKIVEALDSNGYIDCTHRLQQSVTQNMEGVLKSIYAKAEDVVKAEQPKQKEPQSGEEKPLIRPSNMTDGSK